MIKWTIIPFIIPYLFFPAKYMPNLKDRNISIYCYESQYGITEEPAVSITWAAGTYVDETTGIRRNSQGDYLCAMGTPFGSCGDRFKVICEGGESFTVQIGDSKGDHWYHEYGDNDDPALSGISGWCVIEFIVELELVPSRVVYAGSYHLSGLIPTGIEYIVPID